MSTGKFSLNIEIMSSASGYSDRICLGGGLRYPSARVFELLRLRINFVCIMTECHNARKVYS